METSDQSRARYEAECGLHMCYAYGTQWANVTPGAGRGGYALQQLKSYIKPNSTKVRFAMNFIRGRIRKVNSRLMPRRIPYTVKPSSRASNDSIAALVADARLKQQIKSTQAVGALRRAYLWRVVLGSVVVRRSINQVGPSIMVRDASGEVSLDRTGRERKIKTYSNNWAVCPPYEFIRDPSATTACFDDEEIIGHEKARTTGWVQRKFGKTVESKADMGQLLECQRFLNSAIGDTQLTRKQTDSKLPAVMVSEWWFKDDSSSSANPWPWHMIAYRDTCGENPDERSLHVLQFGKNPYFGLPLHHFEYDPKPTCPWSAGVPELTIPAQDASNLAFVSALKTMIAHGNPRWTVEANSLTEPLHVALANNPDHPIEYHTGMQPPTRIPSAPLDSTTAEMLAKTGDWLDEMLTMAPVQSGKAVARGEAAKAYEVRRDAADTPLTAIIDGDRLIMQDLLHGTIHDIIKTESVEVMINRLSHEFTEDQIKVLKQQDSTKLLAGIEVDVDKLRPRTPQEAREDAAAAIGSEMLDPVEARRTLWIREGIAIDERESRAMQTQQQELASMLMGEQVDVYPGQYHEAHKWIISLEMDDPRWAQYTDDQRDAINEHDRLHDEAMQMLAQVGASLENPEVFSEAQPEQPVQQQPTSDLVGQQPPLQIAQPQLALSGQGSPSELPPGIGQGLESLIPSAPMGVGAGV